VLEESRDLESIAVRTIELRNAHIRIGTFADTSFWCFFWWYLKSGDDKTKRSSPSLHSHCVRWSLLLVMAEVHLSLESRTDNLTGTKPLTRGWK
jgi:hypothetical protein